jgi:hypothetical protein
MNFEPCPQPHGAAAAEPAGRRWRRSSGTLPAAGWIFAGLAGAVPAPAAAQPDQSASARIEISVSVAIDHWLRTADYSRTSSSPVIVPGNEQFCLPANSQAMRMPVMLAWSAPASGPAEASPKMVMVELARCGNAQGIRPAVVPGRQAGLLIIRPE